MKKEIVFVVEEDPEGGFCANALEYSIYTQADTMEELKSMARDAVRCHFEEDCRPDKIRLRIVKEEVIPA